MHIKEVALKVTQKTIYYNFSVPVWIYASLDTMISQGMYTGTFKLVSAHAKAIIQNGRAIISLLLVMVSRDGNGTLLRA